MPKKEKRAVVHELNGPKKIGRMLPLCHQTNLHRDQPDGTSDTLSTEFEI